MEKAFQHKILRYSHESSRYFHQDVLIYLVKGSISVENDEEKLICTQAEACFLSGMFHNTIYFAPDTTIIELDMCENKLSNHYFPSLPPVLRLTEQDMLIRAIIDFLEYSEINLHNNPYEEAFLSFHILSLLSDLLEKCTNAENDDLSLRIMSFLRTHFRESLTLEGLAGEFHFSRNYFSRYFKKTFGITLRDQLKRLRAEEAIFQIQNTKEPITHIALQSGFANYNSMVSAIHELYGTKPADYRSQHIQPAEKEKAALKLQDISYCIPAVLTESRISRETQSKHITIDTSRYYPVKGWWNNILNVGKASDCLHADVQDSIRKLHSAFNFRYIRIHSILEGELIPLRNNEYRFNYSRLFSLIDFLGSIDTMPIFDLAIKPSVESASMLINDAPYNDDTNFWLKHLTMLIDACKKQFGTKIMSQWKFELWLPRCWEQPVSDEELLNYRDVFVGAYKIIKQRIPLCEVGGPAIQLVGDWEGLLHKGLTYLSESGVLPDFMSFQLSAEICSEQRLHWSGNDKYEKFAAHGKVLPMAEERHIVSLKKVLPMSEDRYIDHVARLKTVLTAFYGNSLPPLIATDIASDPTPCFELNDGAYPAAFALKSISMLKDMDVNISLPFFQCKDSDYADENALTCGNFSLFYKKQLKSPIYFAYEFLESCGTDVIQWDKNVILTKGAYGVYYLLIHNCKLHSEGFSVAFAENASISFRSPLLYQDYAPAEISFSLTGVQPGHYTLHEYLISDDHGCIAASVKRLNFTGVYSKETLDYLNRVTVPLQHIFEIDCTDSLDFTLKAQPNDILLLRISLASIL